MKKKPKNKTDWTRDRQRSPKAYLKSKLDKNWKSKLRGNDEL